jgi:probable phosphoglycerate mutase
MTEWTLVLVRHGQTAWNAAGRFQGQSDPPLDAGGHHQIERTAARLVTLDPCLLVSSDLRRARRSAELLGRRFCLPAEVDPALREVALGAWEGLDHRQVADRFPDEYRRWTAGLDIRRGGGETRFEAGARAATALTSWLARCPPDSTMVAVSHGLVLQAAVASLAGRGLVRLPGPPDHLPNGGSLLLSIVGEVAGCRIVSPQPCTSFLRGGSLGDGSWSPSSWSLSA